VVAVGWGALWSAWNGVHCGEPIMWCIVVTLYGSICCVAYINRRSGSIPAQFECHMLGQAAAAVHPLSVVM
jgi:hypothetical protein